MAEAIQQEVQTDLPVIDLNEVPSEEVVDDSAAVEVVPDDGAVGTEKVEKAEETEIAETPIADDFDSLFIEEVAATKPDPQTEMLTELVKEFRSLKAGMAPPPQDPVFEVQSAIDGNIATFRQLNDQVTAIDRQIAESEERGSTGESAALRIQRAEIEAKKATVRSEGMKLLHKKAGVEALTENNKAITAWQDTIDNAVPEFRKTAYHKAFRLVVRDMVENGRHGELQAVLNTGDSAAVRKAVLTYGRDNGLLIMPKVGPVKKDPPQVTVGAGKGGAGGGAGKPSGGVKYGAALVSRLKANGWSDVQLSEYQKAGLGPDGEPYSAKKG